MWEGPEHVPVPKESDGLRRIKPAPISGATRQPAGSVGIEVVNHEDLVTRDMRDEDNDREERDEG